MKNFIKSAFTLAEDTKYAGKFGNNRRSAFTLAEALITIGIIGVVAAILLPTLVREVTLKVDSSREANIAQKITKAMENMSVNGDFTEFESTADFVNTLQKYLKISKICDADHLADCWPTRTVKGSKGETIQVNSVQKGTDLHVKNNESDNVGLVLADGSSVILTYDTTFDGFSPDTFFTSYTKNLPIGFGKYDDFAYSSTVTAPIDYVTDVNGSMHPNRETAFKGDMYDVRSFRAASFGEGTCPGFVYNNICFKILKNYSPINCNNPIVDVDYKDLCITNRFVEDYWAGSYKACKDIDMNFYEDVSYVNNLKRAGIINVDSMNEYRFSGNAGGPFYNQQSYNIMRPVICVKE